MNCRQSWMVGWSGTSSPRLEYSRKTWPMEPSGLRLRKTSPQGQWKKLGMVPRILPWVPFPAPGAPKSKMVRYFIGGAVARAECESVSENQRGTENVCEKMAFSPHPSPRGSSLPTSRVRNRANPEGILQQSPGLRATSYPGSTESRLTNANGVACVGGERSRSPVGVETRFARYPRVARRLATLGWRTQSLWDCLRWHPRLVGNHKRGGQDGDFSDISDTLLDMATKMPPGVGTRSTGGCRPHALTRRKGL